MFRVSGVQHRGQETLDQTFTYGGIMGRGCVVGTEEQELCCLAAPEGKKRVRKKKSLLAP